MRNVIQSLRGVFNHRSASSKRKSKAGRSTTSDVRTARNNNTDDLTEVKKYTNSWTRFQINVMLIGSPCVGKRCFVRRAIMGKYITGFSPVEEDTQTNLRLLDRYVLLEMESFSITSSDHTGMAMEMADYFIFTYNAAYQESFDHMLEIFEQSMSKRQQLKKPWSGAIIMALASDLSGREDSVDPQLGFDFARSKNIGFIQTSAKTGLGCSNDDISSMVLCLLLQRKETGGSALRHLRPSTVSVDAIDPSTGTYVLAVDPAAYNCDLCSSTAPRAVTPNTDEPPEEIHRSLRPKRAYKYIVWPRTDATDLQIESTHRILLDSVDDPSKLYRKTSQKYGTNYWTLPLKYGTAQRLDSVCKTFVPPIVFVLLVNIAANGKLQDANMMDWR
jgi:hypothetical protein